MTGSKLKRLFGARDSGHRNVGKKRTVRDGASPAIDNKKAERSLGYVFKNKELLAEVSHFAP